MDDATARALNAINRRFYEAHAAEFAATRDAPWPGWDRALAPLLDRPGAVHVLDVGCGNGRLAVWLAAARQRAGHAGLHVTGVDASAALLARARETPLVGATASWHRADFVETSPDDALPCGPFDAVVLFGVLHGVPGRERRRALVSACAARLAPRGLLVLTGWRFAELPRFQRRLVGWEGRDAHLDLEPGDHLLRWGDEDAVRYCHAVDAAELEAPADLGLEAVDAFLADGREGDLNRYAVFRAPAGRCKLEASGPA